jgi:hypothetical protein
MIVRSTARRRPEVEVGDLPILKLEGYVDTPVAVLPFEV